MQKFLYEIGAESGDTLINYLVNSFLNFLQTEIWSRISDSKSIYNFWNSMCSWEQIFVKHERPCVILLQKNNYGRFLL